ALASVDPAVPPLGEVDVDPVAGQLGHATTADATRAIATPASTTTTARRAGRSHARRRASTSRSCAGARTRAVVARGSPRSSPNVPPINPPAAAEPASSSAPSAVYTAERLTTVTTPRPSWTPNAPPYTQPR